MDGLTKRSLSSPISAWMFFAGILLLGLISFFKIPVSLFPNTTYPGLTLQTEYFGTAPDKIEEVLTRPLEEAVSKVGGIVQLFSVSEEGKSKLHIEFNRSVDIEFKSLEIRDKVDLVVGSFPREVQKPVLLRYDPDQKPVFIIVLKSTNKSIYELREIADREIKKLIEGIPGVSEVFVAGGKPREILVSCAMQSLVAYGITMGDVLSALQKHNINSSAGNVEHEGGKYPVYIKGRFLNIREIQELILHLDVHGKIVRLKDIADANFAYRDDDSTSRVNGQDRVSIYVHRAGSANLLEVTNELERELEKNKREDLAFEIAYNQADLIRSAIYNMLVATLFGVFISLTFLFILFEHWKKSLTIILTAPFSILICSFFLFLSKFDYNLITLTGMILSVGFSFNIAILMFNEMEKHGILIGVEKIQGEILTIIMVVGAVFFPLIFSSQEMKLIYGGLALVILIIIAITLLLYKTIVPILFVKDFSNELNHIDTEKRETINKNRMHNMNSIRTRLRSYLQEKLTIFFTYMFFLLIRKPILGFAFYFGFIILGSISYSFSKQEFINQLEEKQLNGQIEFPSGTSYNLTNKVTSDVEKKLSGLEGIKEVNSKIDAGQSTIVLKLKKSISNPDKYMKYLEEKVGDIKPAFIHFSTGTDESSLREISIDVLGEEIVKIDEIIRGLVKKAETIPGIGNIFLRYKPPRREMQIVIDKLKSEEAGLTSGIIGQVVRYGIQGGVASKFLEDNREVDIRIRYKENFRDNLEKLRDFSFKNLSGSFVPLTEVAEFKDGNSPVRIYRKNKKRTLSFSLRVSGISIEDLLVKLEDIRKTPLPENYRIEFGEEFKKLLESQKKFEYIILLALLLIFMVLASYFESLWKPFLLLFPLPVPIFSAIISLFLFNIPISIPVYIGIILLAAMSIQQSMILIKALYSEEVNTENENFRNFFLKHKTMILERSRPFIAICFVLLGFYIPLSLITGEGGGLLRSISLTILPGIFTSTITTPLLTVFIFFIIHNKVYSLKKWAQIKRISIIIWNRFTITLHERYISKF